MSSIHLSVCLSIHLSTYLPTYHQSFKSPILSISLNSYQCLLSIHLYYLFIHPAIYLGSTIHSSLPTYQPINLIYPSRLSILFTLSIHLSSQQAPIYHLSSSIYLSAPAVDFWLIFLQFLRSRTTVWSSASPKMEFSLLHLWWKWVSLSQSMDGAMASRARKSFHGHVSCSSVRGRGGKK